MFGSSLGFVPNAQSQYLQQAIANVFRLPYFGVPVCHFKASLVEDAAFDKYGKPDYLAADAGEFDSGVQYEPNPDNPLRGVYCKPSIRPNMDKGGIIYQAELDLYLPVDVGDVFVLEGDRPKRQDKFEIQGARYYATAPALPCQIGEVVSVWKIPISRERFPVRLNSDGIPTDNQGWILGNF